MCGIFGVLSNQRAVYSRRFLERVLRVLVTRAQSRGKDSSGLVVYDQPASAYRIFKGALPAGELFQARELADTLSMALDRFARGQQQTLALLGHSRLVTNGTQLSDENNQPVLKSGVIGIHNGIIVNDAALWAANPEITREFQIDTEVMLALFRQALDQGAELPAAMAQVERQVIGTVSTALLVPDQGALILYTNNGSLYTLTNRRDLLLFASEYYPLKDLAAELSRTAESRFELQQVECGSGMVVKLSGLEFQSFTTALSNSVPRSSPATRLPATVQVTTIEDGKHQLDLVRDVALIARAPEATGFEAMLEFNHERVARLHRCSKCLLPETFPMIEYDAQGVCNYCRNYKTRNQPKPPEELLALLAPYRRRDGQPDCIVPYSGGRDSTYALHVAKTRLGLNPIAFTYDWGMVTDLGRRNIARVCGKLRVENIIVAADIHRKRDHIHRNVSAWLRRPHLGMVPLFMAGDKYFYYYVEQVKRHTGISLNLWGVNPLENTEFKVGFLGVPPDHDKEHIYSLSLKRKLRLFQGVGLAVAGNPGYLNRSVLDSIGSFLSRSVMAHRDYFHLYDYFQWNEQEIDSLLLEEYDWERAIDTDTTWRIGDGTAAFYNYIYFTVAGFSEHDTFRSNQIREGMMTREKGLQLVNRENRPRYPTIKWYTEAINIDYQHAIRAINGIPKLYG